MDEHGDGYGCGENDQPSQNEESQLRFPGHINDHVSPAAGTAKRTNADRTHIMKQAVLNRYPGNVSSQRRSGRSRAESTIHAHLAGYFAKRQAVQVLEHMRMSRLSGNKHSTASSTSIRLRSANAGHCMQQTWATGSTGQADKRTGISAAQDENTNLVSTQTSSHVHAPESLARLIKSHKCTSLPIRAQKGSNKEHSLRKRLQPDGLEAHENDMIRAEHNTRAGALPNESAERFDRNRNANDITYQDVNNPADESERDTLPEHQAAINLQEWLLRRCAKSYAVHGEKKNVEEIRSCMLQKLVEAEDFAQQEKFAQENVQLSSRVGERSAQEKQLRGAINVASVPQAQSQIRMPRRRHQEFPCDIEEDDGQYPWEIKTGNADATDMTMAKLGGWEKEDEGLDEDNDWAAQIDTDFDHFVGCRHKPTQSNEETFSKGNILQTQAFFLERERYQSDFESDCTQFQDRTLQNYNPLRCKSRADHGPDDVEQALAHDLADGPKRLSIDDSQHRKQDSLKRNGATCSR